MKDIQDALNYLDSHYTFSQDQVSRRRLLAVIWNGVQGCAGAAAAGPPPPRCQPPHAGPDPDPAHPACTVCTALPPQMDGMVKAVLGRNLSRLDSSILKLDIDPTKLPVRPC